MKISKPVNWLTMLVVMLSLLFIAAGCGGRAKETGKEQPQKATGEKKDTSKAAGGQSLKFMGASPGAGDYAIAVALGKLWQEKIPSITGVSVLPGGAISDVVAVSEGKADLGLSSTQATVDGYNGVPPNTKKYVDNRELMTLYPRYGTWVALADSGVKTIQDIKGKKVFVGEKGLSAEIVAKLIARVYGLKENEVNWVNLGYQEGIEQMKDGRIPVAFLMASIPHPSFADLAIAREIRLLDTSEEKIKEINKINPGLTPALIPKNSYRNVDYDVHAVQAVANIIISKNLPEDMVYQMAKVVGENYTNLQAVSNFLKQQKPADIALDAGIPFHPGALKYYKEKGWVK